ncbi:MAG: glutaredoxin 3 [Paracoccaceae bacterium]|jgi:glutaredoxin 3|nr:glutaredoxin 3 [Paracoccaceae bacterium]
MATVEVYTRPWCGFCSMVKRLLNSKNINFTEIDIGRNPELKQTMIERSNRLTFPQVFLNGKHIGDCMELHDLDRKGLLDKLLKD